MAVTFQIRFITNTQGMPQPQMLNIARKAKNFFRRENGTGYPVWRLKVS